MGSMVTLPGDGVGDGYLALPESGSGPGVLVIHAWWGRTPFITRVCDRLAAAGFVALAPDLYGGPTAATIADAEQLSSSYSADAATEIANAAVSFLASHPAVTGECIAAVGFSLGGSWALSLSSSRPDDVRAVVTFYGAGEVDAAISRASYLGHFAENDPYESDEYILPLEDQLRAAGRPVTFHRYPDTGHWFFEDDRPDAYNADAAALAWERTVAFLRE